MRILYMDIDTLRPDHLGCYGYIRDTSPNIDRIASQGVRFDKCYVSDAPCLPSRASMFTGRFGIHTGVVNHGGLAADMRPIGHRRGFNNSLRPGFVECLRACKIYPVSISPFATRHAAWWFYAGWREMIDTGRGGLESAEQVEPFAIDWLGRNAKRDDWMLHVNIWDPHTPYRAPGEFGEPFADAPMEDWYNEELRRRQWDSFGPGSPQEPAGNFGGTQNKYARQPNVIASMDDYRKWINGYDTGVLYADRCFGRLLDVLDEQGVLDETIIIITSDHGENLGEIGVIGDHVTADHITSRVPMIIRWPGAGQPRVDDALHYQSDVAATVIELAGGKVPDCWDGRSFAQAFKVNRSCGRQAVVFSQSCWSCMRAVRWGDWVYIRSYHTGLKNLPPRMLFNVADDPHELNDLATSRRDLADHGQALLDDWSSEMMSTSDSDVDPMWTVIREGGPFPTRGKLESYCQRLRQTGRAHHAETLLASPAGPRQIGVL